MSTRVGCSPFNKNPMLPEKSCGERQFFEQRAKCETKVVTDCRFGHIAFLFENFVLVEMSMAFWSSESSYLGLGAQ